MTAVVGKNKVVSLSYVLRNPKGDIFEIRNGRPTGDLPTLQ